MGPHHLVQNKHHIVNNGTVADHDVIPCPGLNLGGHLCGEDPLLGKFIHRIVFPVHNRIRAVSGHLPDDADFAPCARV